MDRQACLRSRLQRRKTKEKNLNFKKSSTLKTFLLYLSCK